MKWYHALFGRVDSSVQKGGMSSAVAASFEGEEERDSSRDFIKHPLSSASLKGEMYRAAMGL